MTTESSRYDRLLERYNSGQVPWDDPLPPPEVQSLLATLPPGQALDLGCGYGRASIYMAAHGWAVDAIDFIAPAVAVALERAQTAGLTALLHAETPAGSTAPPAAKAIHFYIGSVIQLDFLSGPYDFALDVGCCHNLDADELQIYGRQLARFLRAGSCFLLFARLREQIEAADAGPSGLIADELVTLLEPSFQLLKMEQGQTDVADQPAWPSAWFLFQRR